MCDRIVVMKGGLIEQVGTPHEIYERPATPFVASFVGRTNRVKGKRTADGGIQIGSSIIRAASTGSARTMSSDGAPAPDSSSIGMLPQRSG